MNFQTLFELGMKRELPDLLMFEGLSYDIGASGKYQVDGAIPLGLPDWEWPLDKIPALDSTVSTVHCYHFLEHLTGHGAISFLREAERVMIPGKSVLNFCIPYYNSVLANQDLTHRSSWNEETFRNLFDNPYYNIDGKWNLKIHFLLLCGIVQRNMCMIGQLVKI